jgi:uncharacterized membrane protein
MKEEKIFKPYNGYGMLAIAILMVLLSILILVVTKLLVLIAFIVVGVFY